ncbi:DUF3515 domain-containing protein [Rathayibacter tritici]|nr:DUF3515 domain-containing protein [Rathayibacter tritici]PPF66404.1 DUF3515 domain-containing protein [Rathayibacter tritici]PPG09656.1 DUF3515 domain-containing protein [Rathayibacter tritici]PPI13674.1 DUF3515 domain-containing protein [Rathayibacter tritici]PPI43451.1 DUF3515 domain-containing protein [Rathayibacter tritici]
MVSVRRSPLCAAGLVAVLALTACSPVVALDAADDSESVNCATISSRLPSGLIDGAGGEIARRETNAQATAAWGSPAVVLLRCGLEPPAIDPRCIEVNGIDWIPDDSDAPRYRFITFGRTPATEVIIDSEAISGSSVLVDLASAVGALAPSGDVKCQGLGDIPLPTPRTQ